MATRRDFLASLAGAAITVGARPAFAGVPHLMSAARVGVSDEGVLWGENGLTPFKLPSRGHALTHLSDGKIVVTGRRPGLFASIVDPAHLDDLQVFQPAKNARFAGHAAASADGAYLMCSEFDVDTVRAMIVSRDPATGAGRAVWTLNDIEPHELLFAKGGARVVVAIGGLIKDGGVAGPAYNPGGIKSAVLEVDPKSGVVLARHALHPSFSSLSLRHLSLSPDGTTVAVAAQDQDLSETRPLVALLRLGKGIEPLPMPDVRDVDFRGYVGSIAFDAKGGYIAAASPRGSVLGVWSGSGAWCGALPIADVCGVAAGAEPNAFWASSGHGGIYKIFAAASGPRIVAQWHVDAGFDNHLLLV